MANEPTPGTVTTVRPSSSKCVSVNSEQSSSSTKAVEKCDLGKLMSNVRRLEVLSDPFIQIFKTVYYILSWEFPALTAPCWVLCTLLCVTTTKGHLLLAILLSLITLAGVGIMAWKSRRNGVPASVQRTLHAVRLLTVTQQDVQYQEEMEVKEALSQYREFILDLQPAIILTCQILQKIYDILLWHNVYLSAFIYIGCISGIVCLHYCPMSVNMALAVNTIFLANGKLFKILTTGGSKLTRSLSSRKLCEKEIESKDNKTEVPDLQTNTIATTDADADKQGEEVRLNSSYDPNEVPEGDLNKDADPSRGSGKTSMVDRFRELRQRHKKLNSGTCMSCGVTFTTVLKRRRYCRHCGDDFCSKCCNKKVPRSVFGATAPAAHTEKELVCNSCYNALVGEDYPAAR
ncbi:protrudin-like isoform X2 [Glandiceps talaboti]